MVREGGKQLTGKQWLLFEGDREKTWEKLWHLTCYDRSHQRDLCWGYRKRKKWEVGTLNRKKRKYQQGVIIKQEYLYLWNQNFKKRTSKNTATYFSFDSLQFGKSHLIAFIFSVNKEQCLCKEHFLCQWGTEYEGGGDEFERFVKSKFEVAAHNKNGTSLLQI